MKKVTRLVLSLVLFVSAILVSSGAQAQTTLLSEGFDGTTIPTGWTQVNELGSTNWLFGVVGGYSSHPATTHSGAYNARLYSSSDVRTLLVSPSMNFGTNTYATLTFWHTQASWAGDQDTLSIVYRTSPTNPWIRVAGYTSDITAWTKETITLPGVNGTYQIGFRGYATYGYGVCLDDVEVIGMTPQIAPPPTITIGNGTSTATGYPYNTFYMDNRTQIIYTKNELVAGGASAGNITNFGLNIATAANYLMNGFTIKMAHTTAGTLSGFATPAVWNTVYNTNMTISTTGWQNIALSTPFSWNGVDNILMEICFDNSGFGSSNPVYTTATTGTMTAYRYQDVSSGGGCTLTGESNTTSRPNARFSFAPTAFGMFMGNITSCLNSSPIANATLTILGNNFTTSATGFYLIQIGVGTYNVTVSAPGFINKTVPVTVTANNTATLNVCLDPIPAVVTGIVTNAATGAPLNGARVYFNTVPVPNNTVAYTNATGAFTVSIPGGGNGNIYADKPGFDLFTSTPLITVSPNTYTQNAALNENLNTPVNVVAALNTAETQVNLNWGLPIGAYLLSYDDGIAENFTVWASAGNMNAVKFTPLAYPVTLTAGRVNIGQPANYAAGANPLKPFKIAVYDASGPGGTPGVAIVPAFDYTPGTYGWNVFNIPSTTITSGAFYIAMIQGGTPPNAAGLAIDTTTQQLRSYSKFGTTPWIPASGNFMIRAVVNGTGGPLMAGKSNEGNTVTATAVPGAIYQHTPGTVTGVEGIAKVTAEDSPESLLGYQVYRLKQGEETNNAVWTSIGTPTATTLVDPSWPSLPCGPYRWAVTALYSNNRVSAASFSNVLGKCWTANVTVNVALSCDSLTPANTKVVLQNLAYPDTIYTKYSDATGVVVFNNVWKGNYKVTVSKFQFTDLVFNPVTVMSDVTLNAILLQIKTPPTGMNVDDRSLWSTWNAPKSSVELFKETFTTGGFTTNQWVVSGANWRISTSAGQPSPCANFYYDPQALAYSQTITSKNITGLNSPVLKLKYDIMLDNYGTTTLEQMAVEIFDGTTWHTLMNYDNSSGNDIPWTSETLDISTYTGNIFQIRFRAYGEDSNNIDNWFVDNIIVEARGPEGQDPCLLGYNVYLNNVLDAFVPPSDTSYRIPPSHVTYGTTYNACVLAIYGSGYSTTSCDVFTSKFLYPPTNLEGVAIEDAAYITWDKPVISDEIPDNAVAAKARTSFPVATSEYSPTTSNAPVTESPLAIWDVLFSWPVSTAGVPNGQVGVETKDQFIYTSAWSGGPAWFAKYSMTGSLVEVFNISGATAIRDLACDGTYFYGAAANTSLYKMDFTAHTLVATIPSAVAIRHIAYDPQADAGNGGFWAGDWAAMAQIKMTGALIANATIGTASAYGSAYDNASTGGPFLWVHSQDGTPALTLTQYKINGSTLTATGVSHLVSGVPGVASSAIAGGLCSGAVNGKFALIGAAQDAANQIFALELSSNVPNPTGGTPQGLIGYNVYRDGAFRHFVPNPDTLYYYDMNLDPDTYCYDVSAKYDLTTYGFPGQFDESLVANSGPACVDINYGRPIPFFEPWDAGNFSFNSWTTAGANWSINTGIGNTAPSADFSWQPILHNYSQSIETPILTAAAWTCAELWLDFDLKLADRNSTGDEKLVIEVYSGGSWSQKAEFTNTASFDWTAQHVDMKAYQGKAFKVRFTATGANSDDILHWYVDNIHVYGVCKPPVELSAVQQQFSSILTWSVPECPQAGTLMNFIFDDGVWENGWRYNPGNLGWFGNYFPIDPALAGVLKEFQVYFVDNGSGAPFNMSIDIFDNAQTMIGSTAAFNASAPDIWIPVTVNDVPFAGPFYGMVKWDNLSGNSYYLGTDENGPNVGLNIGFQYDGSAFSNTSAPCVFLMRATAMVNGELKSIMLQPNGRPAILPAMVNNNISSVGRSGDSGNHDVMGVVSASDSSTLVGYNVWRTDETGTGAYTKINTAPVTALTYTDVHPSTLVSGIFKYYVTSLFNNSTTGTLLCESPSDTVSVSFPATGINDLTAGSISIYPNPAVDFVNVIATSKINSVEVLNFLGQTVYNMKNVNSTATKFDVRGISQGVYFVKVSTDAGTKTTKITVTR